MDQLLAWATFLPFLFEEIDSLGAHLRFEHTPGGASLWVSRGQCEGIVQDDRLGVIIPGSTPWNRDKALEVPHVLQLGVG